MSIASRITSIENHIEEAYTEISRLGVDLTNVDKNIDNIADKLQDVYADLPKVTGEGSSLSLTPTRKGGLSIIPKGACEQDTTTGKNLCNERQSSFSFSANSNTDMKIINTEASSNVISLTANTKYYISYNIDNDTTSNTRSTPHLILGSTSYYQYTTTNQNLTKGRKVWEFTAPTTGDYEVRYWVVDNSETLSVSDFMISTSSDTTFEPYTNGPSPNPDYPQDIRVVTGDNDVVVSSGNHVPNTWASDYVTRINNTGQAKLSTFDNKQCIQYESNAGYGDYDNKYLYKEDFKANTSYKVNMNWYKTSNAVWNFTFVYTDGTNEVFTPDKEISLNTWLNLTTYSNPNKTLKYIRNRWNGDGWGYIEIDSFKVEETQTITLHLGTNYLAGIGDYKDEIVGKTDEWKIRRNINKIILDGSESGWTITNTGTENWYYKYTYSAGIVTGTSALSNYYLYTAIGNTNTSNGFYIVSNAIRIRYGTEDIISNYKNWLGTHNVIIYYASVTPTEIPITDTQIIESLNNMYNLMGYDGQTNITISSNSANAQMIAQISALKGE